MEQYADWFGFKARPDNLPLRRPGVYSITNLTNGAVYIGISVNVRGRLLSHAKGGSPPLLRRTLLRFGLMQFLAEPIYYHLIDDVLDLPIIETTLILIHNSHKTGYNVQLHSDGSYGEAFAKILREVHARPEWRAKMAALWDDPVYRANHREGLRSYSSTEEGQRELSERALAMWQQESYITARAESFARPEVIAKRTAIFSSPVFKATIAASSAARWQNPVYAAITSASVRRAWSDPDLRSRHSDTITKALANPIAKERQRRASKEVNSRPEVRAKHSERVSSLMWVTDGETNRRIPVSDTLSPGWKKGRSKKDRH